MNLDFLKEAFKERPDFASLIEKVACGGDSFASLSAAIHPLLIASLLDRLDLSLLIIAKDEDRAERLASEIRNFTQPPQVLLFPGLESPPFERALASVEIITERLKIIDAIRSGQKRAVVSSLEAALLDISFIDPNRSGPLKLQLGDQNDLYELAERLLELGYQRNFKVESKGEFALRGGIIDIFPPDQTAPIRLELNGDLIESIRSFDVASQLSLNPIDSLALYPCRDFTASEAETKAILNCLKSVQDRPSWLEDDISRLETGASLPFMGAYARLIGYPPKVLCDFFGGRFLLILDDPSALTNETERLALLNERIGEDEPGKLLLKLAGRSPFLSLNHLKGAAAGSLKLLNGPGSGETGLVEFLSKGVDPLLSDMDRLRDILVQKEGLKIVALRSMGRVERMAEIIQGFGLEVSRKPRGFLSGAILLIQADLDQGFELYEPRVTLIGESDIFIKVRTFRRDRQTAASASPIVLAEMKPGDRVVHRSLGIGLFIGLTEAEALGIKREYVLLEYKDGDRLYVPFEQISLLSKYTGAENEAAPLSKLGMKDWAKAKARVKKSVKKLAFDLLALYAHRMEATGHSFAKDTVWQAEMEETFPFVETADQEIAINEVKTDMEAARPMDRLVCGDVGYGKTEVALRAAFKAALDGKQVLILVPTTILAQQHFFTFKERFAPYPIKVELLSRFRKKQDERRVLSELQAGAIDVIIGTHRLLQKDVIFKEIGLVIIDEEQRFGVASKEHFKTLRKNVDVLTMSATPIPRTLQMSLSGVRDFSVITTPPEDRFPIITKVGPYDEKLIRSAVERELARGGQVFYVHNRVITIETTALKLRGLFPDARITIAHGQMDEAQLERVMESFLAREQDILLCTTIIESGIDIPSANTIIVEMAEKLGLAQMYQLRGRVGRSHHLAYAYFFSSKELLGSDAQKRLEAIKDFTELGSGIKIALKDLEIRGAGNILGADQHGQMEAVGFELYNQLLKEAILELKGEEIPKDVSKVALDLPVQAIIPKGYINNEALRIEVYRQIAMARSEGELNRVAGETRDRFGRFGSQVQNLFLLAALRLQALSIGIDSISSDGKMIKILGLSLSQDELDAVRQKEVSRLSFSYKPGVKSLTISPCPLGEGELFSYLKKLLDDIIKNRKR